MNTHEEVSYTIKKSARARVMRLSVYYDGRCTLTVPERTSLKAIEAFIQKKYAWIIKKIAYFKEHAHTGILLTHTRSTRKEYLTYKETARALVLNRLEYFNQFYGFNYNTVNIKNTKSRWGSCSQKGNLNFNYKLALIPPELADYIVVHELCHIGELNHSKKFWALVEKTLPNYVEHRKKLSKLPI